MDERRNNRKIESFKFVAAPGGKIVQGGGAVFGYNCPPLWLYLVVNE